MYGMLFCIVYDHIHIVPTKLKHQILQINDIYLTLHWFYFISCPSVKHLHYMHNICFLHYYFSLLSYLLLRIYRVGEHFVCVMFLSRVVSSVIVFFFTEKTVLLLWVSCVIIHLLFFSLLILEKEHSDYTALKKILTEACPVLAHSLGTAVIFCNFYINIWL